jgi:hypothetical protein
VVDRAALEMRSTRKGTGGSNPSLSATPTECDAFFPLSVCASQRHGMTFFLDTSATCLGSNAAINSLLAAYSSLSMTGNELFLG